MLYHFPSKDAVVRAAYESVIEGLTADVGAAVAPQHRCRGVRGVHPLARGPSARAAGAGPHDRRGDRGRRGDHRQPGPAQARWQTVADLVEAAKQAGDYRADVDPRVTAIVVNGAIDAIVAERMVDRTFDTPAAAEQLIAMLRRALSPYPLESII